MARNITVTFDDGTSHVYENAPDDVTPESVTERAAKEFNKTVVHLDGGRNIKSSSLSDIPADIVNAANAGAAHILEMPVTGVANAIGFATGKPREEIKQTAADIHESIGAPAPQTTGEKTIRDIVGYPFEKLSQLASAAGSKFEQMSAEDREKRLANAGYKRDENGVLISPSGKPVMAYDSPSPSDIAGGAAAEVLVNALLPMAAAKGVGLAAKGAGMVAESKPVKAITESGPAQTIGGIASNAARVVRSPESIADQFVKTRLEETVKKADLSPEKIAEDFSRISSKGGSLADVSPFFSSDLASATRGSVEAEIAARRKFASQDNAGEMKKLLESFGEGSKKAAIEAEEARTKPIIDELYQKAREESADFSSADGVQSMPPALQSFYTKDTPIGDMLPEINKRLSLKRQGGQESTPFDVIQKTLDNLNAKIAESARAGDKALSRDYVLLKKKFLETADNELSTFAEARKTFAGKQSLQDASNSGDIILKMPLEDLTDFLSDYTPAEKAMALLDVKKQLINKIDNAGTGHNLSAKLFGKNGDAQRIRTLFDDQAKADQFISDLKDLATMRETQAKVTSGSMTARNLGQDENAANLTISDVGQAVVKDKTKKAQEIANKKLAELYLTGTPKQMSDILAPSVKLSDIISKKSKAPVNPFYMNQNAKEQ